MPQLDSLRALAFFGVAVSHWWPGNPVAFAGGTGVQLFFVLSGFLITGILLDYRQAHESIPSLSAGTALRTFYIRRFFRILPLYYGVIVVTAMLNVGPIRQLWPWHVFYVPNFLYALEKPAAGDPFTHFWSLGVEEQFYVVWPFLVFFIRIKTLERLILSLLVAAPLFRIAMQLAFPELHRANYLPLSCGDSLGAGACLAFAARHNFLGSPVSSTAQRMGILAVVGGVASAALIPLTKTIGQQLAHTFLVLFYGWLVFQAAKGFDGWIGAFLNRPELQFLGKISYGLYVFHHFFTPAHVRTIIAWMSLPPAWGQKVPVQFVVRLLITVGLAALSWYLYEKPFNNLKRYFTIARDLDQPPRKGTESNERLPASPASQPQF